MSAESLAILMAVASGVFGIITSIIGWVVSRLVAQLDRLRARTEQLPELCRYQWAGERHCQAGWRDRHTGCGC